MNRRLFWLGYLLAIVAVAWFFWRQRQEEVEEMVQRWRQARPGGLTALHKERAEERPSKPQKEQEARQAAEQPAKAKESLPAHDLQEINGIGPAFARRLQEAGITRFEQLAALAPHEVRERTNLETWQGDVDSWIEQAQVLSSTR